MSERASVARRIAMLRGGGNGLGIQLGKQEFKASLDRILQASPELSSLSPTVREVLREVFSSEATVSLEAAIHHPYPTSLVLDRSADSLYSLIAALSLEPNGESVIDLWTESNLLPAMLRVSHVVDTYERLIDACVPETGYFNVSVEPRRKRDVNEQVRPRGQPLKKAELDNATSFVTYYNQSSKTAKSIQNSLGDRFAKAAVPSQSRLPLAPKWPRQ